MDREQPDAVDLGAVDRLRAEALVPLFKEVGDAGYAALEIARQMIEERAHVGVLVAEPVETEKAIKPLGKVYEGHGEKLGATGHELRRKHGHISVAWGRRLGVGPGLTGDIGWLQLLAGKRLGEERLGESIVGVGEIAHGIDNGVDSLRRVETERLVGHHLEQARLTIHQHRVVQEIVGYQADVLVLPHDNRDVAALNAIGKKRLYDLPDLRNHQVVVVIAREKLDYHLAGLGLAVGHLLYYVGISLLYYGRVDGKGRLGGFEETVVEIDNVALRTVIGVKALHMHRAGIVGLVKPLQQLPVAIAPTIYALLDVAHDKAASLMGNAVVEKHLEIGPLHG